MNKPQIRIKSDNAFFVIEHDRTAEYCWKIIQAPESSNLRHAEYTSLEVAMAVIATHLLITEF